MGGEVGVGVSLGFRQYGLGRVGEEEDFSAVASFLMSLPNLENLVLEGSNLTGSILPEAKTRCSGVLSSLDLAENDLSGPVSDLRSFLPCSSLSSLNLSNNLFDFNPKLKDFSNGLRINFRVLDLSYNKISCQNAVPWLLSGGCADLQYLSLKGNKISGEVSVSGCKALEYLDLSANNFTTGFPSVGDCSAFQG